MTADEHERTIADDGSDALERDEPEVGRVYGRYVVTGLVGHGGMGSVFAGADRVLGREVAIKVIPRRSPIDAARLLREAQALAALSHPNVVTVFEVGTGTDGHHFIAMERVRGTRLDDWFAAARPWSEVLDVMLGAGAGLAAAHACGLVHRDFKPANVIVGDDGRARVLDFGLVVAGDSTRVSTPAPAVTEGAGDGEAPPRDAALTGAGIVMGTPAYMAPEQWAGVDVGPASDQWAYCVTLFEGVYHRRPFPFETIDELRERVARGLGPRPATRGVPRWIWPLIRRGLAREPNHRWPSMQALLDALQRGRRRGKQVWMLAGTAVAAAAVAALAMPDAGSDACADGSASMDRAWSDDAREAVAAALQTRGAGDGKAAIVQRLDAEAGRWHAAHASVCASQGAARHFDRAMACLADRRRAFEAVANALAHPDAVVRAGDLLDGIPEIAACVDPERLAASLDPPDAGIAATVDALRADLERARTLVAIDRPADALVVGNDVLARAESIGYAPLTVEARVALGSISSRVGDTRAAMTLLEDGYWAAVAAEHDVVAAHAAASLVEEEMFRGDYEAALTWVRHARSVVQRSPAATALAPILDRKEAAVVGRMGRFAEAEALARRALDTLCAEDPPRNGEIAMSYSVLGHVQRLRGQARDSVESLRTATEMLQAEYGVHHSRVASGLVNLGLAHLDAGDVRIGRDVLERAVAIAALIDGAEHREAPAGLMALAHAERRLQRYARARELFEQARRIYEREWGPDALKVAYALEGLAAVELDDGSPQAAIRLYERVLELRRDGSIAPSWTAQAQFGLARALRAAGRDPSRSIELAESALRTYEAEGHGREADVAEIRAFLAASP